MDSIQSTTGDVSSKQQLWSRDQISQLVEHLRLDQSGGASLNQSASEIRRTHMDRKDCIVDSQLGYNGQISE